MLNFDVATYDRIGVTAPPLPLPLVAGIQEQAVGISRGYRPTGTDDWLLVLTLEGKGYVRSSGGAHQVLRRGSVFLIAPGEHQEYGHLEEAGIWTNIWIHFRPRSNWVPWLEWPRFADAIGYLNIADDAGAFESRALAVVDAVNSSGPLRYERAMNSLESLLLHCQEADPSATQACVGDGRVKRAIAYIESHIDDHLTILQIADSVGLSRSRLTTLFRKFLGLSPQGFIEQQRLNKASRMLVASTDAVAKVAEGVGFTNPYYFSTRFRRQFGVAPSQYRLLATSKANAASQDRNRAFLTANFS